MKIFNCLIVCLLSAILGSCCPNALPDNSRILKAATNKHLNTTTGPQFTFEPISLW